MRTGSGGSDIAFFMFFWSPSWRCLRFISLPAARLPASCAGPKCPSHNQLFPGGGRGDRRQELQQRHQPITPLDLEARAQGVGQRLLANRGHEASARLFPERAADKGVQPPLAPTLQGAAAERIVGVEQLPDTPDPLIV